MQKQSDFVSMLPGVLKDHLIRNSKSYKKITSPLSLGGLGLSAALSAINLLSNTGEDKEVTSIPGQYAVNPETDTFSSYAADLFETTPLPVQAAMDYLDNSLETGQVTPSQYESLNTDIEQRGPDALQHVLKKVGGDAVATQEPSASNVDLTEEELLAYQQRMGYSAEAPTPVDDLPDDELEQQFTELLYGPQPAIDKPAAQDDESYGSVLLGEYATVQNDDENGSKSALPMDPNGGFSGHAMKGALPEEGTEETNN